MAAAGLHLLLLLLQQHRTQDWALPPLPLLEGVERLLLIAPLLGDLGLLLPVHEEQHAEGQDGCAGREQRGCENVKAVGS